MSAPEQVDALRKRTDTARASAALLGLLLLEADGGAFLLRDPATRETVTLADLDAVERHLQRGEAPE